MVIVGKSVDNLFGIPLLADVAMRTPCHGGGFIALIEDGLEAIGEFSGSIA